MVAAVASAPPPARAALFAPANAPRLVVKIGSALLVGADGAPRREWLAAAATDLAALHAAGQRPVVVSSGAVALGARALGMAGRPRTLEDAQAAAAVGQIRLAGLWAELMAAHGLTAAQMLLTPADLEDRRRYLNAAATLDRLLSLGAIPVLNENDSVATEELRFGDNDRLAARVAHAARASACVLLSDVAGLYTANPATDRTATLIPTVTDVAAVVHMADGSSGSGLGRGGMAAKLEAARIAAAAGVHLAIAAGHQNHALARFLETGEGTIFLAPAPAAARKAWLTARAHVTGRLEIDAGAVAALRSGKSLLAAGITAVEGRFARGDALDIAHAGATVARGLAGYDALEVAALAGHRNDAHAAILGYAPRSAVVHRDQMVIL